MEAALKTAYRCWLPALEKARVLLEANDFYAALLPLSEAIHISAAYHPEFHFLESSLNTELGRAHLQAGEFEKAHAAFDRAVFLHHQNEVALAGRRLHENQPLPAYRMAASNLTQWAMIGGGVSMPSEPCIFTLREKGELGAAIELIEATHKEYHKLAAEPWFLRAKAHRALGESELAANDQRRAEDLQPARLMAIM